MGMASIHSPVGARSTFQRVAIWIVLLFCLAEGARAIQLNYTYSPSRVVVGDKLTCTYWLENGGATDESGTLFTNQLPGNTVFVSAVVTNGAFWVSNNVLSYRPETLPAGKTTVISVVVTPINVFDVTNHAVWVSSAGELASALFLVPVDGARPGPQLVYGRTYHTSTVLRDGRVLVTGGQTHDSSVFLIAAKFAEVYNPATESFSLVGDMTVPRMDHTATMLTNGMVLIAGGRADESTPETAEVFDPVSNTFTHAANLQAHRNRHTTTMLPNGDVLLAGGAGTNTVVERLHRDNGLWAGSSAGHLVAPRSAHVACLLPNGKILFAGGTTVTNAFAEIFDPESGTSQLVQTPGSRLPVVAASTGKILLDGYLEDFVPRAEIYDIESNSFTPLTLPPASTLGSRPAYLEMADGNILKTGGFGSSAVSIFDLLAGTVTPARSLAPARGWHTAVQFANGRIMLLGGFRENNGSDDMRSTAFYAFRLDSDLDGIDDEWELVNGMDATRREDAVEDDDEDGHTNLQEFLAGTDPQNPLNALKIEPPQIVGNQMLIRFSSVSGKYYRVEKGEAENPGLWVAVSANLAGNGGLVEISDPIESGEAAASYRVLLVR